MRCNTSSLILLTIAQHRPKGSVLKTTLMKQMVSRFYLQRRSSDAIASIALSSDNEDDGTFYLFTRTTTDADLEPSPLRKKAKETPRAPPPTPTPARSVYI